ncbi:MAG: hypothetical protein V4657_07330 [Pseudomonadota bacterium]
MPLYNPSASGGPAEWGGIAGSMSAQTDLASTLADKCPTSHGHGIAEVTGLVSALAGKQAQSATLDATTASFTTAQQTKLSGIATAATANAADAQLRDRASHTGAQAISSVTGLQTALDGKQASGSYEAVGTAASAISAHTAAGDPHPQYLTAAEGNAAYAPIGGGSDAWTWAKLASDSTVSTIAFASVPLSFTAAINTTYLVEVMGAYQAAATTTGIALALDIPAGAEIIGINIVTTSATALGGTEQIADATTTGATTGVRALNTNTPISAKWLVRINATGGTVQLMQRSEIAASNTVLKANITAMGYRVI